MRIQRPNREIYEKIRKNWDAIAKPLNGLGRLEELIARIGAVQGTEQVSLTKRGILILCADNGVVREGISQSGQEVTEAVASWMGRNSSTVCRMAAPFGIDILPVDIGINREGSPEGLLPRKIRPGTRDILLEPAMTEEECRQAVRTGIDLVRDCREQGYRLLAAGEIGIGNTTTAAAVTSALLDLPPEQTAGRGAGLPDDGLLRKRQVIRLALERAGLAGARDREDPAFAGRVLCEVGGLDIAGMAGVYLGGAIYGVPVLLDGFVSAAAALAAERLAPGTKAFMIPSQIGREPGMRAVLDTLGFEPVLHGDLALGEGTGAALLIPMLDMALALYRSGLKFNETKIAPYVHYEPSGGQP